MNQNNGQHVEQERSDDGSNIQILAQEV